MIYKLSRELVDLFYSAGKTVFVAESCTAGLLCASIAGISGASRVLTGGIVAYDNVVKSAILGVPEEILYNDGAVSFSCARSMAEKAQEKSGASYGISITGIAGPGGGTLEKPVGTVFIGILAQNQGRVYKFLFTGNRNIIRKKAVLAVLNLLITGEKDQHNADHLSEIQEIQLFTLQ